MKKEKNLLDKIEEAINTEDCCMECLLIEIVRLINEDTSYDKEVKRQMLETIYFTAMYDKEKVDFIAALVNEYKER